MTHETRLFDHQFSTRRTGTIGRLCRPRLVRLTLGDEPVFVVGELVTVLTADVDAGSVRTRRRVEVGVGNIQRRTAHRCRRQYYINGRR
jgi:hypothetical protein